MLIGLDWVEPMMQFLLHVTYSCISYAYVLLFIIFDIFVTVWDFSNCHSFSPSLLVYVSRIYGTSCTRFEQTLFKQIVTGEEVLALVHLFLLKKLLCMCTVGFCDQASS